MGAWNRSSLRIVMRQGRPREGLVHLDHQSRGHKPGAFRNRGSFLILLKDRKSRIKVPADPAPGKDPLLVLQKEAFQPDGPRAGRQANPRSLPGLVRTLIPPGGPHPHS